MGVISIAQKKIRTIVLASEIENSFAKTELILSIFEVTAIRVVYMAGGKTIGFCRQSIRPMQWFFEIAFTKRKNFSESIS